MIIELTITRLVIIGLAVAVVFFTGMLVGQRLK